MKRESLHIITVNLLCIFSIYIYLYIFLFTFYDVAVHFCHVCSTNLLKAKNLITELYTKSRFFSKVIVGLKCHTITCIITVI